MEGKNLPPLTDELVGALSDVAPSLTESERRALLELARSKLRPRPKVLENFEEALRKRAMRIHRKNVHARLLAAENPPHGTPHDEDGPSQSRPLAPRLSLASDSSRRASASIVSASSAPPRPDERHEQPFPEGSPVNLAALMAAVAKPLHDKSVLLRARLLHEQGLHLLPLMPGTKEPSIRWAQWQKEQMPLSLLRGHLESYGADAGLAIICGEGSELVVADLDDETAVAWAKDNLPPTPWMTKTARGQHWFYRYPPAPLPAQAPPWKGELQADGRYVVAPGSLHPGGARYQALGDWTVPKSRIPVFEARWLVDLEAMRQARLRILRR